ncbi:phosphotransferase [Asanoa sp. NPDC049518]|uniref:phosphotransferase n=1 Tax=unclassified Asanoa TaxID=2685164 RepID=UPI00344678EC
MIRPLRSLLAPDAVAALVSGAYDLPVDGAVLLRTLVNDVYRVDTGRGPLVLKIYRRGATGADWEALLADHVAERGVPTVRAVPLTDGTRAGTHDAPEGERTFVLWEWAPGALPGASIGDRVAGDFGWTVAAFHEATDASAEPPPATRRRDLAALGPIVERLRTVLEPDDRELVDLLAAALPDRLGREDLDRGICHGDVSLDNLHVDGDRLVLYDLDLAAQDWRAADLTGVATTPWWPAFLAGYRTVRPFGAADLAALPWLTVRGLITNLHFHLVDKPTFRGTDSIGEGWADRELRALRAAAGRLLGGHRSVPLGG